MKSTEYTHPDASVRLLRQISCPPGHKMYHQIYLIRVIAHAEHQRILGKYGDLSFHAVSLGHNLLAYLWNSNVGNPPPCIAPARNGCEKSQELLYFAKHVAACDQLVPSYFTALRPLLSRLPSGYYLLADMSLYPATGKQEFFWNVQNEPSPLASMCEPNRGRAYPAFIYPTQQPAFFTANPRPATRYHDQLKINMPYRAVCYYLQGYLNLLLHGHQLASTAAATRSLLPSLVIIPPNPVSLKSSTLTTWFAYIPIPLEYFPNKKALAYQQLFLRKEIIYHPGHLTAPNMLFPNVYLTAWAGYPLAEQLIDKAEHAIPVLP